MVCPTVSRVTTPPMFTELVGGVLDGARKNIFNFESDSVNIAEKVLIFARNLA